MSKYLHNISGETKTYQGSEIINGAFFEIQLSLLSEFQTDVQLLTDILLGDIRLSENGTTDFSTIALSNFNFLLNKHTQTVITTGTRCPDGMRARLVGIGKIAAVANTNTNLDWKIPQLTYNSVNKTCYFDGVEVFAKNASVGDTIKFQVIDKDNVLGYGVNTVLEEFGTDWYVIPDVVREIKLYKARLITDLYIRIIYTNTHATQDVDLVCNIFRHLDQNS